MRVFTYSEARKRLAEVLDMAKEDEVIIRRRNGDTFSLMEVQKKASPLDIDGVEVDVRTHELVAAVRESRER
ncbi:prevent-host-death protein [Candidatus Fermentibacteria bacterium]|nr:prevent-host-death protein [Candidatus Fermentibacteria bacterium]